MSKNTQAVKENQNKEIVDTISEVGEKAFNLPVVKSKWKIKVMQFTDYKDANVCIRHIPGSLNPKDRLYGDYFEYIVFRGGKIYSNYIVLTPSKRGKKLNSGEVNMGFKIIFAGAVTTVDTLIEKEEKGD